MRQLYCRARIAQYSLQTAGAVPSPCCLAARAAKGGTQALKPFLANLYQSRARSYRDAVQQFVQGYKQVGGWGFWGRRPVMGGSTAVAWAPSCVADLALCCMVCMAAAAPCHGPAAVPAAVHAFALPVLQPHGGIQPQILVLLARHSAGL